MSHHYVQFSDVHYTYPNGYEALRGVTFRATHGEKVAIVGANGAGKSTLMLHTNGLLLPTQGEVVIGDVKITRKTLPEIRRTVGIVFQNPDDQLFMPTVEEDVAFGPCNMKLTDEEVERRVTNALEAVGASELRERAPYQLSGGQKRSVAIATVLSMEPDILVLDEPSSNLDPRARRLLMEQIRGFYHTCLITSHDLDMVRKVCTRTIVMAHGTIVADGPTEEVLDNRELLDKAGL
ncbi:MAG: energy-coupling factor ABC transporter ATP-binding protein [Candidatus Amulumruptor caecigallinarius]|nr:energy-coupling factor ABC transporter ATP-binding protein [Candidatus Amulumruptor caecigallinarius]MCM1396193.1 energy-coupling factor ABC transporter ATP-binding protein [Candidatus Amulumruptor caecigallinarius]MCM1453807.1 energy-coupling factor ABC transporter ATP-binding protein [bacterium]